MGETPGTLQSSVVWATFGVSSESSWGSLNGFLCANVGAACEDAHTAAASSGHLPGAAALGTLAGKCSSEPPAFWLRWALQA